MIYYIKNKSEKLCLRKAKRSELTKIAECVKEVYSGCYLNPEIFKPEYKVSRAYAAFNEKNEVAATLVFSREQMTGAFDMIMHTVKKEYRGNDIGTALTKYAIRYFKKNTRQIICAHPVTAHSAAQRQLEKCGLIPTGFLFNIYNSEKYLTDDRDSEKQSLGVYVLPPERKKSQTLYLPEEVSGLAGKIYSLMNTPYIIYNSKNRIVISEKSRLNYYNDEYHNTLYIWVSASARDLNDAVKGIVNKFSENPLQSVIVYLNINDSNAVFGYKTLVRSKYIFSGFNLSGKENGYAIFFNPLGTSFNVNNLKTTQLLGGILKELGLNAAVQSL